jgi:hypothetical protein
MHFDIFILFKKETKENFKFLIGCRIWVDEIEFDH